MGRQSSSPDSLTFENIYQLPFFVSALPPEINDVSPGEGWYAQNPPEVPPCPRGDANFVDVVPSNRVHASLPILFRRFILTVAGEPVSAQG
jgi:hypothetical protein